MLCMAPVNHKNLGDCPGHALFLGVFRTRVGVANVLELLGKLCFRYMAQDSTQRCVYIGTLKATAGDGILTYKVP